MAQPSDYFLSRPPLSSLTLRPGDSLTIPWMALSVGFIRFVSSTNATQATGLLTIASVGLPPTEHASLRWTHSFSETRFARESSAWIGAPLEALAKKPQRETAS